MGRALFPKHLQVFMGFAEFTLELGGATVPWVRFRANGHVSDRKPLMTLL